LALYRVYQDLDASLLEINPLIVTRSGALLALDAKFNIDANAVFRHPDLAALRDPSQEDPMERRASEHELNYVSLEGDIACMVNGAGLAMATMDLIKLHGGSRRTSSTSAEARPASASRMPFSSCSPIRRCARSWSISSAASSVAT
ncbi:succinyl-CoA synthetase beta subunit, partial [mine drainage metagenome]